MFTKRILLIVCFAIIGIIIPFSVEAQTERKSQVVRIGYYEDGDFMHQDEYGDYVGFNFEFLQEIAKYTGWEYEIMDGGSWENSIAMLESGKIDILPSVYFTDERAEKYLFSNQPICNIYATLNVRSDDLRYDYESFHSFNGMKIGVISNSKDYENFITYSKDNNFNTEIVTFSETGELLNALENGVLDGIAITHLGRNKSYKSVARFAPEPLYIAINKEKSQIAFQLNSAMNTLRLRNPNFEAKMYNKYFSVSTSQKPVFTKEELDFIEQSEEISAIYDSTWAPLEYTDPKTGEFVGTIADLFHEISEETNLKFKYIPMESASNILELSQDSNINVICGIASDYIFNNKNNLYTTQYYLRVPIVLVTNENAENINKIAMQKGYLLTQKISDDNPDKIIQSYTSPQECFEAILSGEADATYINTHIADYLLSDSRYSEFTVTTLANYSEEISIAVSKNADPRLFSILDKCIQYTATEKMDELILKNSIIPRSITWQDIIREHPVEFIGGILGVFSITTMLLAFLLVIKSKSNHKIEKLLYKDSLTELWNLDKFCIEAQNTLKNSINESYAVVYVDIKQFRTINDTFGFSEGDWLLCAFAQVLEKLLSSGECCARVSADQFVLLLRYDSLNQLTEKNSEIDYNLKKWVIMNGRLYNLILVFGVYVVTGTENEDISLMLDFASYAKRTVSVAHKSLTVFYDEKMRAEGLLQRDLADRMQDALTNGEFVSYYQPKVDMRTGKLVGSEALVRWNYPEKGVLSPGAFIPFFEKNGFVVEIDFYIFEQICKDICGWMEAGRTIIPVSCNFSRLHFKNQTFPQKLVEIADYYKVPHQYLELEVTESIFVGGLEQILEHFTLLKSWGFLISIDDFGSGYSSLGLLQQFSVDIIKLDRSFIQQGMRGKREQTVVYGVIQLANALDMKVICEGVEEIEQVMILKEMGCYLAQGYFYAKPMPKNHFEKILVSKTLIR